MSCLSRKYIKANPETIRLDQDCHRVYVNVISANGGNTDDIICCNESNSDASLSWSIIFSSYEHGLCNPRVSHIRENI